jgi:hypothetical protein
MIILTLSKKNLSFEKNSIVKKIFSNIIPKDHFSSVETDHQNLRPGCFFAKMILPKGDHFGKRTV